MQYRASRHSAAAALASAMLAGSVFAQVTAPRVTDTAPAPPEDRSSVGAVVLIDQPVLAQREYLENLARTNAPDTRSLGAGPARVSRKVQLRKELDRQRAADAALQRQQRALDVR